MVTVLDASLLNLAIAGVTSQMKETNMHVSKIFVGFVFAAICLVGAATAQDSTDTTSTSSDWFCGGDGHESATPSTGPYFSPILQKRSAVTWLNRDQALMDSFTKGLKLRYNAHFVETPLDEVCKELSKLIELPIIIDRRAFEEIGLTNDTPISLTVNDVSIGAILALVLQDLDSTYTTRNSVIEITTIESAQERPATCIYWLDDTGMLADDPSSAVSLVMSSIEPGSWESGNGSVLPVIRLDGSRRTGVVFSTIETTHLQIENLFAAIRAANLQARTAATPD
ncbi:hypothetical protein SH528x_003798 [Novipirellula sp. SH528]|uniref:hypothetical protein n=1 Tax=Novipirellula sp. SH528 TaxID=3454466 RepID=UPI003F9EC3F3